MMPYSTCLEARMNDVIFGNQRDVMSKKPKCRRYRHMWTRKVAPKLPPGG